MKRISPFAAVVAVSGTALIITSVGSSQGVFRAYVGLQPSSPGISQSGHLNVTGTAKAGTLHGLSLRVSGGASPGSVLKSDAIGNATWQQDGLALPYSSTMSSPNVALLSLTNIEPMEVLRVSGPGRLDGGVFIAEVSSGIYGSAIQARSNAGQYSEAISAIGNGYLCASFTSTASNGIGISAEGGGAGLAARSSGSESIAVMGENTAQSGQSMGAYFVSHSSSGTGVYGSTNSPAGTTTGGMFVSGSSSGRGVIGTVLSNIGPTIGVQGSVTSPEGIAVRGVNTSGLAGKFEGRLNVTGATTIGTPVINGLLTLLGSSSDVLHVTNSGSGRGLFVITQSDTSIFASTSSGIAGIDARNSRPDGYGVYGFNLNSTGSNVGVLGGTNSATGYGVFSIGNSGASGVKSFRIDHPLDPDNKFLLHYSAEGPEPMNVYSGNVTTNAKGEAWVQLPDYFGQINRDLRYTLTVIDDNDSEDFVLVKVAKKVQNNRFKIRSSAPNVEGSWRVEGVRNDRWVQEHGAPSEVDKSATQRGRYQHPELYGLPPSYSLLPQQNPVTAKSKK